MRKKNTIYNIEEIRILYHTGMSIRKLSIFYNIPYTSLRRELTKIKRSKKK